METEFSIVMPVFNAEKYLNTMIESIINQTYDKWHLIIIDDGSTDNSSQICDSYCSDKIEVHHTNNRGQNAARCLGIDISSGDYTLVVDADDFLRHDCLEQINNILLTKPYDIVMFPYLCCDEKLNELGKTSERPNNHGEMKRNEILEWVIKTCNHGLCNKAIKTDIIKAGAKETIQRRLSVNGDYALIIPILCYVERGYFVDDELYHYRMHKTSLSHNYSYIHIVDTDDVSIYVIQQLKRHGILYEQLNDLVHIAYLHMIARRLVRLFCARKMGIDQIDEIKGLAFYNEAISYIDAAELETSEYRVLNFLIHNSTDRILLLRVGLLWDAVIRKIYRKNNE